MSALVQTIAIWIIIAVCAFFIGRRYLLQWRSAVKNKEGACADTSCCCGCSAAANCGAPKRIKSHTGEE